LNLNVFLKNSEEKYTTIVQCETLLAVSSLLLLLLPLHLPRQYFFNIICPSKSNHSFILYAFFNFSFFNFVLLKPIRVTTIKKPQAINYYIHLRVGNLS